MTLPAADWNYPTRIWFGNGRIASLPEACAQLAMRKPLLVTDEELAGLDIVQDTLKLLGSAGIDCQLYCDVQGNPTGGNVENGVAAYLKGNHHGVIAFGGGSALDAGKAIALQAGQQRPLWDFEDIGDNWKRASAESIAPVIAVPTTAGTGSEVGRAAVILDEDSHCKKIIFHPAMLAGIVISDPQLTLGLPANITAWTGIDALVHAIEAYCAPGYHPMADGIAIEAIRIISKWLPLAVSDGANIDARGQMLVAASMGATAFQKGLGCIHSVSHVLGALFNTHHGLANAIILPYGLSQNREAIDKRMGHLCTVLGLPGNNTDAVVEYLMRLREQLDIPHSLQEIGIDGDRAEEIGRLALADPSTATNARPVTAIDLENLFRAALSGDFSGL
jgi:alcohol dehydrogenase class IV